VGVVRETFQDEAESRSKEARGVRRIYFDLSIRSKPLGEKTDRNNGGCCSRYLSRKHGQILLPSTYPVCMGLALPNLVHLKPNFQPRPFHIRPFNVPSDDALTVATLPLANKSSQASIKPSK
jgi:hypothetical protein